MSEWKVGDMLVSKVTSYATVYSVTMVERDKDDRQVIHVALDGREIHGRFTSSLFERWANPMDDTRSYLEAITSDVERTENEKVP